MEQNTKFNIWYVLAAIWGVVLLQNLIFDQLRPEIIPYSEFIDALKQDRVQELSIGTDRIAGKMKAEDDSEILFTTVRVENELSQVLAEHDVEFSGRVENTFFNSLLSWMIPIFIFALLLAGILALSMIGGGAAAPFIYTLF